jgi:hypothetical protein
VSDLLADCEPRLEILVGEDLVPLTRPLVDGESASFSFRCPNCKKFRIEIQATTAGNPVDGQIRWRMSGLLPELSIHPSIWSKHGYWVESKPPEGGKAEDYVHCEWHRVIFKGRFIDELFAWPVEDPANAKFG